MRRLHTAIAALVITMGLSTTATIAGDADRSVWRERQVANAVSYLDESPDTGPASPGPTDPNGPLR